MRLLRQEGPRPESCQCGVSPPLSRRILDKLSLGVGGDRRLDIAGGDVLGLRAAVRVVTSTLQHWCTGLLAERAPSFTISLPRAE